jgi:hypothetical protein
MTTATFFANGKEQTATLSPVPAMEAWTIKRELRDFVKSGDKAFRLDFALRILAFVSVDGVALTSQDIINTKLGRWESIEYLIDSVLKDNELGTVEEADFAVYDWDRAGREVATAFMSQAAALIGPGLNLLDEREAVKAAEKAGE